MIFDIIKALKKVEKYMENESRTMAVAIAELLDSKKAENIEIIDIAKLSSVADYMVIATVSNTTMSKAIADFVEESLQKVGVKVLRREGVGEWIVLDYNFVLVHIFTPNLRDFYHLDKIWSEGKNIHNLESIKKLIEKEEAQEKQKEKKLAVKKPAAKAADKKTKPKETKKTKKETK